LIVRGLSQSGLGPRNKEFAMSRKICIALVAMTVLGATAVTAHPKLQTSVPARDAKLSAAPKEIRMRFSEGLVANFSGAELKDAKGKVIPTGKALASGKQLVVPITAKLAPGNYTVAWHAVSVDTHRISGSYGFKIVK
jgi:methionine-rich copper-binding protein CopC